MSRSNKGYIAESVISIMLEYCNMTNIKIPCFEGKVFDGCYEVCGDDLDRKRVKKKNTKRFLENIFDYLGYIPDYEELQDILIDYFTKKEEERECHYLHSFFKDSEEKTYAGADCKADLNAYGYNISIKCKGEKNKRIKIWDKCKYTILNRTPSYKFVSKELYNRRGKGKYEEGFVSRMRRNDNIVSRFPFI